MSPRIFRVICNVGAARFIAPILLLGSLADAKVAAQDFWQQTSGPYGGDIEAIAINSNDHIFAGSRSEGVYRSMDNGGSWIPVNTGLTNTAIRCFAINSSGQIFVGTEGGGIFRSTDNGDNWSLVKDVLANTSVTSLAINFSGYIFAGTIQEGVFRSTNNGDSWVPVNTGLSDTQVFSLAINSIGHIFAGTDAGVFRSTDDGGNWRAVNAGLTNTDVYALVVNSSGHIFAGTNGGILRSTDNGETWVSINAGLVEPLAINASGYIFAGSMYGVFLSTNNGNSWTPVNAGLTEKYVKSLAINSNGHLFAGTWGGGVFRSVNNGGTWMAVNTGLTNANVISFVFNSSGHIFAGMGGSGVYSSTDNGDSWVQVNAGLTDTEVFSLAINSNGYIFAGTRSGPFRSTDNGGSWQPRNTGLTNSLVTSLVINSSGHIYAGTFGEGVLRSTNNGDSWTPVNTGLTENRVKALAINSSGHIFAGTVDGGVFRSTNSGGNWTEVNTGLTNKDVESLTVNLTGHIFAGTWNGVFRSTDNGSSWTPVNSGLTSAYTRSLITNSSGHIFVGTFGGVFRSTDNGASWTAVNNGLTDTNINSLIIDARGYVFAGTYARGVFRSIQSTLIPTVTTNIATNVTSTTATINGTVNPNSLSTNVKFEYGTTSSYGNEITAPQTPVTGTAAVAVSAAIAGLSPNTMYYYRVVATNSAGTINGADLTFITSGIAPAATTDAATSVAATSATLNGSVNPNGLSTAIKFQYGTSTSYGSEIDATPSSASGTTAVAVSGALSGLSPNTIYHYRVVATNSVGTTNGEDQSFSTASLAPTVTTNAATNITATSATLNGVVNPNGLNTSAEFEYGLNTDYGNLILLNPLTGTNSVSVSISISRLTPGTTYHYRAAANNSAGTTKGNDQTFTTLGDVSPPQITHSPVALANSGQSVNVSTTAFDNDSIQTATLYYRQSGATSFQSTPMSKSGGINYAATIPAGSVTERGLEYYISVQDPSNNTATYPATEPSTHPQVVRVRSDNLTRAAQTPVMAYRMISVPIELENSSPRNVLEDDWGNYNDTQWRLLRYVSGEDREYTVHNNFDNFDAGKGFWLITRNARTIAVGAGLSVTTAQNFVITLQPGWNQIGNPFAFPVNWNEVLKSGNVESKLVGYQGSLNEASGYDYTRTRLEPWEGYFVNNLGSAPATLEIPPRAATEPLPKVNSMLAALNLNENEWALRLSVASDRYIDKDNYLGCLTGASEAWDRSDFSEAPFFDKHVSLYFPHHEWPTSPGRYTGDFRLVCSNGQSWDFQVQTNVPDSKIKLELAEVSNLPMGWSLTLLDEHSHIAIDLLKQAGYTFLLSGENLSRTFRLLAGPQDYIGAHDQNFSSPPTEFELWRNYPNPFNPETKIGYTLPATSHVRIIVFNATGQQIRKLVDDMHNAGRYTITWNGTNDAGEPVASSIYLLRMEAGDFVALRKMLLAR